MAYNSIKCSCAETFILVSSLGPIYPFVWTMQVSCHLVKLVLRNNALTTLRGIENLKSLEGLDVSYNIISNFSELEFLWSLSSLKELWLEGNPVCCARWYRAHVFSYIALPDVVSFFPSCFGDAGILSRRQNVGLCLICNASCVVWIFS